ncbi:MAG: hypothetical protein VYC36_11515 [Pseudomonadota bacterium]|nr:hypothetical protein [Pseudomonadota bacterium]
MSPATTSTRTWNAHKIQQALKWTVYALLLVNFAFYIAEDWNRVAYTLMSESTIFDWMAEFATSIDLVGWILLLCMLELETYVLEDEDWEGWVAYVVRGVRFGCYAMIAHTLYAAVLTTINLQPTLAVENVSNLCDMIGEDVSYVYNLGYTDVTLETCDTLSASTELYWVTSGLIVTDKVGLELERVLAWMDLWEVMLWLLILLAIETVVRLQDRGITEGFILSVANSLKILMYLILLTFGVYWAVLSHWLYLWDELLWVAGFAAIEMNITKWRDELHVEKTTPQSDPL